MAFIEESVWDQYLDRKKRTTDDAPPTVDSAWQQASQTFGPTGMDGPAPEPFDWQQQLAEQMARRGPTPSTSSLSPSGLAGGTATSTVPPTSPTPEPFGWQDQLAEQMARRGPTPGPTPEPLPSAADRARLFADSAQAGFQRPPPRPVFTPTGMDGPPAPVPNPFEWFGQLNESARQRVPGYAGLADVMGEQVIPAVDKAMVRTLMNAGDVANPLSPRFAARWMDPARYEREAEAAYQANPAPTALIPEGPARGVAGAMGELLHRSAQKAAPGLLGSASRIPATAEDWQRWSTEQSNPLVDVAVQSLNPAYNLGPGEVIRAAKAAGNVARAAKAPIRQAASAVGEALPDMRQAIVAGEAGAVELPRVGEAADTRRFYHGTGSAFEAPESAKFDPNGLKGPGYYLTDEPRVAGSYAGKQQTLTELEQAVERITKQRDSVAIGSRYWLQDDAALKAITKDITDGNYGAPNVRAVDLPRDLPLFDTRAANIEDSVLDTIDAALPQHQRVSFQISIKNIAQNNKGRITGDDVYDTLADVTNSKANANATLERAGYAGLEYAGGRHMPLLDEQGHAIEHSAVVVFPAGLPKIRNAISGTIGGSPPEVGAGLVSGATAYDPNATPEENARNMALRGLGGAAAMGGIRAAANPAVRSAVGRGVAKLAREERGAVDLPGGTNPLGKTRRAVVENPNFQRWFGKSAVVDDDGAAAVVFRGDNRADLIGPKLDKRRVTSGRFYFTEDPEIATGYAANKADLKLQEKLSNFEDWFKFPPDKGARTPNNLRTVWWRLSPEQQARVKDVMLKTGLDEHNNFDFSGANALVGPDWWAHEVRAAHGNWLVAGKEAWLNGGTLIGSEEDFMDILAQAGLKAAYDSPNIERPGVTPVYLSIQRPLDTGSIPPGVVDRLRDVARADRRRGTKYKYDLWDKDTNAKVFVERLEQDLKEGTTYAWTSVPEKITQELQRLGYDGIKDTGGKYGGKQHAVWIAFEPEQVKSALGNRGTYSQTDPNMLRTPPEVGGAVVGGLIYQDDPNLSPAENLARRAAFAGGGAALGNLGRRLGGNSRLGGTIEDVGKGLTPEQRAIIAKNEGLRAGPISVGDFVRNTTTNMPAGIVEGEGTIGKNIPAWKIRDANGNLTAVPRDQAEVIHKVVPETATVSEPVAPAAPAAAAPKQPWEMTQTEWFAEPHNPRDARFIGPQFHHDLVKEVLDSGRPVPPEVLAEYPDLAAKAAPTPPAPRTIEPPAQAIPADTAPVAKSRAQVAREEKETTRAEQLDQLKQSVDQSEQAQVAEQARITEIAREATDMPYEQLASNEDTMRGLLRWYYTKVGNIGMASRLRQGDTIPRVDLSRAQKLAQERLRDTAPDPLAPASDIVPTPAAITESRPPTTGPQPSRWRPQQPVETVAPEQAAQEVAPVAPLEAAPVDAGIVPPSKPPVDIPPTPPEPPSLGPPLLPKSSLPSVKPTRDIIDAAYQPDAIRRLTDKFDNPITRSVAQAIGVAKRDVFTQGLVLRESILADWKSAVVGAISKVRSQGDSAKLFNVDKDGMATIGTRKVALNDVLEYPDRFPLTAEQKRYAQTVHQLYDDQAAGLAAEGIDINQLQFEPGGHYVGRKVYGRIDDATGDVEFATVRSGGPGRVGGKAAFEKGRSFETQAEALKAGFRYMTPEEALNINLNAAGKKIADKRLSDFILAEIPYRTAVAPEELKVARDYARDKLAAWGKAKLVINRGYRGERVPPATVASVGKFFPDVGQKMIEAGITKSEVVPLRAPLQEAEKLLAAGKLQAQRDFYKARDAIAKAMESARAPRYGEGMVMTPAFQGKFFSEADAKRLREITDIEPHSPLRGTAEAVSWINAPARLFMTTWDFGISLIQGQVLLFSRPGTWTKATGRSLQALVSDKGYQGFLADHADAIKDWSQYGAIFTPSEFTEAIGRGGILEKVPVATRVARPFARQYESYLNALRIYGLESTEKLAKTEADKYGLAKFWNEVSGQVDTARMGISPTQRAVESALLFAPRYRRAILSLMTDVARGGLRGKMARDSLAKATVAGLAGYMATWTVFNAIDPQGNPSPHLDPREGSRFLTVKWGSQNIGMGGAYYSTSRALLQMALEPEKTAEIALRYVSGLMSPVAGTAGEMGMPRLSWPEGETVPQLNAPYVYSAGPKNIPLRLTKAVVGENLTPIWAQGWLLDNTGGGDALISTIVESTGGRAFPDRQPVAPATKSDSGYRGPGYSGSGSSAGYRGPGYSGAGR